MNNILFALLIPIGWLLVVWQFLVLKGVLCPFNFLFNWAEMHFPFERFDLLCIKGAPKITGDFAKDEAYDPVLTPNIYLFKLVFLIASVLLMSLMTIGVVLVTCFGIHLPFVLPVLLIVVSLEIVESIWLIIRIIIFWHKYHLKKFLLIFNFVMPKMDEKIGMYFLYDDMTKHDWILIKSLFMLNQKQADLVMTDLKQQTSLFRRLVLANQVFNWDDAFLFLRSNVELGNEVIRLRDDLLSFIANELTKVEALRQQ